MNDKVLKTLEFNKITDMLKSCAASEMGKVLAEDLKPYTDIDEIKAAQRETTEAVEMVMKKGSLSLGGLRDISPYIKRVNVGGNLNIEELLHIGDFLHVCKKASAFGMAEGKNDAFPTLEPVFKKNNNRKLS
jgi:DNA mismatch repair protein MutS2